MSGQNVSVCVCVCVRETPAAEFYEFDAGLLMEPCAPQVQVGELVLNNLTHAPLMHRYVTCMHMWPHACMGKPHVSPLVYDFG